MNQINIAGGQPNIKRPEPERPRIFVAGTQLNL